MVQSAIRWLRKTFPEEVRAVTELWKAFWRASKTLTIIAAILMGIPLGALGYFLGKSQPISLVLPEPPKAEIVPQAKQQLALLRVHYTAADPLPEVIETDNVLKPMSFQWAEDGTEVTDSTRRIKWTMLILVFDKPVTGSNLRVLFEGGEIPIEAKVLTPRYARIFFQGSLVNKTVQVEIKP